MKKHTPATDDSAGFEAAAAAYAKAHYVLRLYVTGPTPYSARARS